MRSDISITAIILIAALSLSAVGSPISASDEMIEPGSWVYPALRSLELAGLVTLPPDMPWSRSEVEFFIDRIMQSMKDGAPDLTSRQEFLLGRLRSEFQGKGKRPSEREDRPLWTMREGGRFAVFDLSAGAYFRKLEKRYRGEVDGVARPEINVDLGMGMDLGVSYRLKIEPELDDNLGRLKPSEREKSFRGLTSEYERGWLSISRGRWRIAAGRDYLHWGSGREESLILSRSAGSLDMIDASVSLGRFRLSALHAVLDSASRRRLAGHRLTMRLPADIQVGVSETVLYTGRGFDFSYMLPIGSYYANQYNENDDDNILWSIDWKIPLMKGLLLYGELLIDDFQYEERETAPDRLGFNLTAESLIRPGGIDVELLAGYTYIDIFTYAHKDSLLTRYVSGSGDREMSSLLGSPLGPDSDRWNFRITTAVLPRLTVHFGADIIRRGEGNDLREWDRAEDPRPPFPSGEVARIKKYYAGALFDMGRGSSISAGGGVTRSSTDQSEEDKEFAYIGFILDF